MANAHLAYPDLAIDKFSGTDPDQDAESFIQLIERKINFALGDAPADAGELANYTFRKKAMFSSLLRGPAAEWYESNITNATTWDDVRRNFITTISDGRNKFRLRMEVEHCIRGDGEEIRNFLHRIKRTVDKGWPDDLNGVDPAQHNAERAAQGRQRRQRYIDYSLKGLRPKYLQRKAQEYLMENLNATWNDFSARIIQRDVSFQVSSNFLNDEEQTKAQMATLGQEMKNLRSELLEHRVNAVEGNSRTVDPNQKEDRMQHDFVTTAVQTDTLQVGAVRRYGTKNSNESKTKEPPRRKSPLPKITTKNEDQTMDQNNGPEAKIFKDEIRTLAMIDSGEVRLIATKISLQDPTLHIETTIRTIDDHLINDQISHLIETMETDPDMNFPTTRMGTGGTMGTFLVLHQIQEETSHKTIPIANQETNNLTISHSADLTLDLQQTLHPMNRNFRKTIIRHLLMWFVLLQPRIP